MSSDNRSLGRFTLDGIPPAPRGTPQIEVTFDIDANGILTVAAVDKATGKDQKITINNSSGLSEDQIDQMVKDASKYEAEDQKKRAVIETRNQLSSLIYEAQKMKTTLAESLSETDVLSLASAIEEAESRLGSTTKDELDSAVNTLGAVVQSLAKHAYETPQHDEDVKPSAPEDIIDAEFE